MVPAVYNPVLYNEPKYPLEHAGYNRLFELNGPLFLTKNTLIYAEKINEFFIGTVVKRIEYGTFVTGNRKQSHLSLAGTRERKTFISTQ